MQSELHSFCECLVIDLDPDQLIDVMLEMQMFVCTIYVIISPVFG
jgi:hypothetical protein